MGAKKALKVIFVLIAIFWTLVQFNCTESSQDSVEPLTKQAKHTPTSDQDCFSALTQVVVAKIVKFFQGIEASGNWKEGGIAETEKKIKIWVLPPGVDFENSTEILHKTSANLARLRLNQFIENSLGSEIEKQNAQSMVQIVGNSEKTVDQLLEIINTKEFKGAGKEVHSRREEDWVFERGICKIRIFRQDKIAVKILRKTGQELEDFYRDIKNNPQQCILFCGNV